jgi:hypothetical protein
LADNNKQLYSLAEVCVGHRCIEMELVGAVSDPELAALPVGFKSCGMSLEIEEGRDPVPPSNRRLDVSSSVRSIGVDVARLEEQRVRTLR